MARIYFNKSFHEPLYISDLIEYNEKEGSIHFNGYYYVEDHAPPYPEDLKLEPWERPTRYNKWLPRVVTMSVYEDNTYNEYQIEIYKRIIHESTDKISEIEEDGEPIRVCFFPTNRQTIYFRKI